MPHWVTRLVQLWARVWASGCTAASCLRTIQQTREKNGLLPVYKTRCWASPRQDKCHRRLVCQKKTMRMNIEAAHQSEEISAVMQQRTKTRICCVTTRWSEAARCKAEQIASDGNKRRMEEMSHEKGLQRNRFIAADSQSPALPRKSVAVEFQKQHSIASQFAWV